MSSSLHCDVSSLGLTNIAARVRCSDSALFLECDGGSMVRHPFGARVLLRKSMWGSWMGHRSKRFGFRLLTTWSMLSRDLRQFCCHILNCGWKRVSSFIIVCWGGLLALRGLGAAWVWLREVLSVMV